MKVRMLVSIMCQPGWRLLEQGKVYELASEEAEPYVRDRLAVALVEPPAIERADAREVETPEKSHAHSKGKAKR